MTNESTEINANDAAAAPVDGVVMRDGDPIANGLYVAYVNPEVPVPFAEKRLLTFINGEWGYLGSDQKYRDHVYGYIGPLPALRLDDA